MSRTDINKVAETILIPLLAEVYGYTELKNLNSSEYPNYPAIDLGDETARVAFQITSTSGREKINKTLRKFVEHELYEKYDKLIIYILTEKPDSSGKGYEEIIQGKFTFDKDKDIWDYRDILREVANFQIDKARKVESILEANFGERRRPPEWEVVDKVEQVINESTQLFVGRSEEFQKLNEFLRENSSGVILVKAGAGFGKTALLANWVNASRDKECFIAYHFFSQRYDVTRSVSRAYRNLLRQLYIYYELRYEQPPNDENQLRERLYSILREHGAREDKPLVIALDGLDEAERPFSPPFPTLLPENVFVIASGRAEEGEEPEYLRGWTDNALPIHLNRLCRGAIANWLRQTGEGELAAFAEDTHFVAQLDEITQGFPLYLSYLTDELSHAAKQGQDVREVLARTPKGFEQYVKQQLRCLDELDLPDERWQFFALLAVAKGALEKEDVKALTGMRDRNLRQLNQSWQVTRWMRISEAKLYAFAHPLLATTFAAQLGDDAEEALQDLIDYCAKWEKYQSRYALRHYAEHLREVERWEELYAIARNEDFATTQREHLPDEPDLSLKTVQTALLGATDRDDAGAMAEFLLTHAKRILAQESPLNALRSGNLTRALALADLYDIEHCVLWYLLLVWELKDKGKLEEARETLERLQSKKLPRFSTNSATLWQGDYATHLLAYVFVVNKDICNFLVQQLFENYHRRYLCKILCEHDDFDAALDTADTIDEEFERVLQLARVAKAQARTGQKDAARSNFAKALKIIHKANLHILWVDQMVEIAKAQIEEVEDIEASRDTLVNALETAQKVFTFEKKRARSIEDKEQQKDTLEEIARTEAEVIEFINNALETAEEFQNQREQHNAVSPVLSNAHTNVENSPAVLEIAETIGDSFTQQEKLGFIAKAQAKANKTEAARATFASALQIAQGAESTFGKALALSDVAEELVKVEHKELGVTNAKIAHQIAQRINKPMEQAIAIAQVAKVLAKAGKKKEAATIFDSAIEIAQNIKIQEEGVNSFTVIAKAQVRIKEFAAAFKTAQRIEFPWIKAEVLGVIAKAQAEAGQEKEFHTTLTTAFEIAEGLLSYMEWAWINVMCELAMAQAVKNKEAALATLSNLFEVARASRERTKRLSTVAVAWAQVGEIRTALKITEEIEDGWEQVIALGSIGWEQWKKGEKEEELKKTLTDALKARDKIKDEQKRVTALRAIAQLQAMAREGKQAVRTAELISTDRNNLLWILATILVKVNDKENFKKLLIPCAYYLDAAYKMCGLLARLNPESKKIEAVAKVVSEFN